ncbi:MAG: iron-sulfur cluster-binding protein [bacterium]|nr:iron-sulfur cluster-binding protein [bacterium]
MADERLQAALSDATDRLRDRRAQAFAEFPEGERLRDRARQIKRHTIDTLDTQLSLLAERFEAVGGVVHWAEDAARAKEVILGLATERKAKLAVKSKSMTTEELGLADALSDAGITPLETDLGEYIIQIAGETPSHIIVPAIHKTFDDVADLLEEKHGTARCEEHQAITQEARDRLRSSFLEADLGISGVNFAVAETGSLVIVENEGNARLSTSLPRCHIAVMGMEKVVPDLEAVSVFLRILARSATGQKMSSYVSVITGPRRSGEEDGPDELHLVIVDNGRSKLLADRALRESLYCIRCGACLNICPVYRHAGGHAYGWVYPGPIGSVINPTLLGPERAAPLPFASSLCGACRDVCPVRINLPHLLLHQRDAVVRASSTARIPGRSGFKGWVERSLVRAYARVMRSERLYGRAGRLARGIGARFASGGRIRRAPGLGAWMSTRDFPEPPKKSFRERWEEK